MMFTLLLLVRTTFGSAFTSVVAELICGVTEISSINLAEPAGTGEDITCLLLVKLSGLKVEQLLKKIQML